MEILFWRHQTKGQKKTGLCKIYCRVTIDGEREDLGSTHIETFFDSFDPKTQRITESDPLFLLKNLRLIEEFEKKIMAVYNEGIMDGEEVTAWDVKQLYSTKKAGLLTLVDLFEKYLETYLLQAKGKKQVESRKGKKDVKRSVSSLKPLRNAKNAMSNFLAHIKKGKIKAVRFSQALFEEYEIYLIGRNYEQSYVVKLLSVLKAVLAWGKETNRIKFDPLENVKVDAPEKKQPIFLKKEQFDFWKSFKFSSKDAQETADLFTIYSNTGFHYQDLKQVIKSPEEFMEKGIDGKTWIYKPREKTGEYSKVPIHFFSKDIHPIVEKYGGWNKLPIKQNHILNAWLKVCVAEVNLHLQSKDKIYDRLSVKHGRCTFSDNWINNLGKRIETLAPMLGRKTTSGLEVYVRADERAITVDLQSLSA